MAVGNTIACVNPSSWTVNRGDEDDNNNEVKNEITMKLRKEVIIYFICSKIVLKSKMNQEKF